MYTADAVRAEIAATKKGIVKKMVFEGKLRGLAAVTTAEAWARGRDKVQCNEAYIGACKESGFDFGPNDGVMVFNRLEAVFAQHVRQLWAEYRDRMNKWRACFHLTEGQGMRKPATTHEPMPPIIPEHESMLPQLVAA